MGGFGLSRCLQCRRRRESEKEKGRIKQAIEVGSGHLSDSEARMTTSGLHQSPSPSAFPHCTLPVGYCTVLHCTVLCCTETGSLSPGTAQLGLSSGSDSDNGLAAPQFQSTAPYCIKLHATRYTLHTRLCMYCILWLSINYSIFFVAGVCLSCACVNPCNRVVQLAPVSPGV